MTQNWRLSGTGQLEVMMAFGFEAELKAEIELLKGYRDAAEADAAVARLLVDRLRLTDAEREAIDAAAHAAAQLYVGPDGVALAATLRGLLERLA